MINNHPNNEYNKHITKHLFDNNIEGILENNNILSFKNKKQKSLLYCDKIVNDNMNNKKPIVEKRNNDTIRKECWFHIPDYSNDYYSNLIDWGKDNYVCIGVKECIYIWKDEYISNLPIMTLNTINNINTSFVSCCPTSSNYIAVGTEDNYINIWDYSIGKQVRKLKGHSERSGVCDWNEHILSTGSYDRTIINWDIRSPNPIISRLYNHTQQVCGLKWNKNGKFLASGGNDNIVNIWDIRYDERELFYLDDHIAAVKAISWSQTNENVLATGGGSMDRTLNIWDVTYDSCQFINNCVLTDQISSIIWSDKKNEIITNQGKLLIRWKLPEFKVLDILNHHDERILNIIKSPCGKKILSVSGDKIIFWNINDYFYSNQYIINKNKEEKKKILSSLSSSSSPPIEQSPMLKLNQINIEKLRKLR